MKKIFLVFGTRPEAIKMAPVIKELQCYPSQFRIVICVTAQHREMLDQVLQLFDIKPNYDLNLMQPGQDLFDITCNVLQGIKNILKIEQPDIVLVHGDTTTSMAASLAAYYCNISIGHIEAGLRTRNKYAPFPEEINRTITSTLTDLHFAPTESAKNNLLREGYPVESISITGNTVIDALVFARDKIQNENIENELIDNMIKDNPRLIILFSKKSMDYKRRMILVTGHRRENFGKGFENICYALKNISEFCSDVDIVYPVHLNPNVQDPVNRILSDCSSIYLIKPQDYLSFVYLMDQSHIIITDSGGVQEEAPSLGKPVLVMREETERPEAVAAGTVKIVGTNTVKILNETLQLLNDKNEYERMAKSINPYGDGYASKRIVARL